MKAKASSDNQKLMFLRHPAVQWVNYAMCLTIFSFWKIYFWQKRPNDSLDPPTHPHTHTLGLIIRVSGKCMENSYEAFRSAAARKNKHVPCIPSWGSYRYPHPPLLPQTTLTSPALLCHNPTFDLDQGRCRYVTAPSVQIWLRPLTGWTSPHIYRANELRSPS